MNARFYLGVLLISAACLACGSDKPTENNDGLTFNDIQPLLQAKCVSCHTTGADSAGLTLDSWASLIRGSRFGEVIIAFDPVNSLLVERTSNGMSSAHPAEFGASTLSSTQIDKFTQWILEGAKDSNSTVPYTNSSNRLYVCNQNSALISVIDTDAKLVIRNVSLTDLGYSANSKPHHIAVEPDGSAWYVSLIQDNKIVKFNNLNEKVADADLTIPALLATHPTNGQLYVSRFMQAIGEIPQIIGMVDRSTMQATDIPVARPLPHAIAASHDGRYIYTCSLSESQLIVIDATSNEVVDFVSLGQGKGPLQLTVSPDDSTLYISTQISNEMLVIDASDPDNRKITQSISVNSKPWHPAFTPDGGRVYVGNLGANTVTAINTEDFSTTVIGTGNGQDGISQPHGIAISKDGNYVFVACRNAGGQYKPRHNLGDNELNGTVVVISTTTNTIEKIIEVEDFASGMAL